MRVLLSNDSTTVKIRIIHNLSRGKNVFLQKSVRSIRSDREAYELSMVARFAPASPGFASVPSGVLIAAGRRFGADSRKEFRIVRYCAMLFVYAMAGA